MATGDDEGGIADLKCSEPPGAGEFPDDDGTGWKPTCYAGNNVGARDVTETIINLAPSLLGGGDVPCAVEFWAMYRLGDVAWDNANIPRIGIDMDTGSFCLRVTSDVGAFPDQVRTEQTENAQVYYQDPWVLQTGTSDLPIGLGWHHYAFVWDEFSVDDRMLTYVDGIQRDRNPGAVANVIGVPAAVNPVIRTGHNWTTAGIGEGCGWLLGPFAVHSDQDAINALYSNNTGWGNGFFRRSWREKRVDVNLTWTNPGVATWTVNTLCAWDWRDIVGGTWTYAPVNDETLATGSYASRFLQQARWNDGGHVPDMSGNGYDFYCFGNWETAVGNPEDVFTIDPFWLE